MLKNILNRFSSCRSRAPRPAAEEDFRLYKKDGQFYPDPQDVEDLDKFESHQAAAQTLNTYNASLQDIKKTLISLEGTPADKNERPDVVAVEDLDFNGTTVDAVYDTEQPAWAKLDARVQDDKTEIHMKESYTGSLQFLEFNTVDEHFHVKNDPEKSYVRVSHTGS